MQSINFNRKYHICSNPFKKSVAIFGQIIEGEIGVRRMPKERWKRSKLVLFFNTKGSPNGHLSTY